MMVETVVHIRLVLMGITKIPIIELITVVLERHQIPMIVKAVMGIQQPLAGATEVALQIVHILEME